MVVLLSSIRFSDALVLSSPECGCKLLTIRDYTNLLWTTFAEFPGEFQQNQDLCYNYDFNYTLFLLFFQLKKGDIERFL